MWSIAVTENTVKISKKCADELFACQSYGGEIWYGREAVTYQGKLCFNEDHMEHMDFLSHNEKIRAILKKHKVKGDICFGSLEGDNAGSFWGYRFDGRGGMQELVGQLKYEPVKPAKPKAKKRRARR
jgi:hypothetical protein